MSAEAAAVRASPRSRVGAGMAPLATGLVIGAVVALLSVFGVRAQVLAALVIALPVPVLLMFLLRPVLAFGLYLAVLPVVLDAPFAEGLNAGEMLTLGMMALTPVALWSHRQQAVPALRSLLPIVLPLVALAVLSVASILANGVGDAQEIISAVVKMLAFAAVPVLVYMVADRPERVRLLVQAILLGGTAVAVYSIVAYLAGWSYSAQYDWNRAHGTFENWNQLGGFMVLVSMPTLALALSPGSNTRRMSFGLMFVLQVVALLLSSTLGSLVALLAGGAVAMLFLFRVRWSAVLASVVLFLIGFATVYFTNPLLQDKLTRIDERVLDRLMTYAVGWSMMRDQFWFGFGSQSRVTDALRYGDADYGLTIFGHASAIPHNSFLLMGVEKGILGLLLFAALVLGALLVLLRRRRALLASRRAVLYQGIVVGGLAFLIQNMTNNLILHARIGILFLSLVALTARLGEEAAEPGAESERAGAHG